jgi:hypothetical protein
MANNAPTQPTVNFEVFKGETLVHSASLNEQSITVGSGDSALVVVADGGLQELHAVLNVEDDGTITVMGLEPGLSVKGAETQSAAISSGGSFEIGDLRFVVSVVSAATAAAPVDDFPMADDTDEQPREEELEDVMEFVMRSGRAKGPMGLNLSRPKVLEVNQVWDQLLLDTQHYAPTMSGDVTIGSGSGWRWYFLGVDMGWVPNSLGKILNYTPPMWSETAREWRDDFFAPTNDSVDDSHVLFEHNEDDTYTARVSTQWDGFIDRNDQRTSFKDAVAAGQGSQNGDVYEFPMDDESRMVIDVNGTVFVSHMVHAGAKMINRQASETDYPFIAILSFIGFLGLVFGSLMFFSPKPAGNQMVEIPDRFVELLLEKPEIEEKKKKKPDANPDAGEGAKAKKEEGKVGKKDAKMEKAKGNKVEVKKKELDRKIAEDAGVLGALADAGDLDGMFGNSGLDANLTGGIGGLIGAKGTQIGAGGLGARGSGLGGGGTAEGLGGLGTKGIGSGSSGYGSGGGSFGAKGEGGIGAVGGDPIILGALDRSLIDEVIKRHMNQIRYCYQRELTKNPSLAGKVVVKFVIAKDGSVSSASKKTSTINNGAVEQCVVGRFMRMQFPEPKGGGIVIVSYPFTFLFG